MSFCLCQMAIRGFYIPDSQADNAVQTFLLLLVLNAALILFSYNKRSILIGFFAFIAAAAVYVCWLVSIGEIALAFLDTVRNPYMYYMVCVGIGILAYLLSATRRGTFVLLLFGILLCSTIHYLYHDKQYIYLIGFLISCMASWILKNYHDSVLDSRTKKVSFQGTFLVALVCCALAVGAGCGIYYAVVKPIGPPVQKLALFDKKVSTKVIDVTGLAKTDGIIQQQKQTGQSDVKQKAATDGKNTGGSSNTAKKDGTTNGNVKNADTVVDKSIQNKAPVKAKPISYILPKPNWILTAILIAAVVALILFLKNYSHKLWLKRIRKETREEQISRMYHLFLKKFRQLKLKKNKEETPLEYASRQEEHLAAFAMGETDMYWVTDVFVQTSYGQQEVDEQDYQRYVSFYHNLFKRIRNYLGPVRFLIFFFRI